MVRFWGLIKRTVEKEPDSGISQMKAGDDAAGEGQRAAKARLDDVISRIIEQREGQPNA